MRQTSRTVLFKSRYDELTMTHIREVAQTRLVGDQTTRCSLCAIDLVDVGFAKKDLTESNVHGWPLENEEENEIPHDI